MADRSTIKKGLLNQVAWHQFLQQLSVTLWCYNASMIPQQYALSSEDDLVFIHN